MMQGTSEAFLQQAVRHAVNTSTPLKIVGGNSKTFLGRETAGLLLSTLQHQGIVNYHPSELIITARAGTSLSDIEQTLAEQGQMLAFEPPHFSNQATLGGTIACGLSGPRRPFTGSARDFVLGCKLINGKAEIVSFGGEVMKNVAGYDISRLMVGAMGTLGVLLEISLKVLPLPALEQITCFELEPADAIGKMAKLASQSLPVSGLSYDGGILYVRLSGAEKAVKASADKLGGDKAMADHSFLQRLNEQRLDFFQDDMNLWRIVVPPATAELDLAGAWLYDWGGGQRWLKSEEPAQRVFSAAEKTQGHAVLFRSKDRSGDIFQPLSGKLQQLNRNIKQAFDPLGIFNPNRMYGDW
ncbi:glycolate oxidase subunit GlcE [Methylobacter sp. YRD-M1]|uniref:glycolate oxidase subunit GlcE n=1 Tax=Methylobacter sp. YRD-M1 TaxID=2911520 RepID=UPI00227B8C47|nr:glycolate oxidase subunit GlcE [Methylobacter sp. YRD-M1]WAK00641.1 glycolate oxidase subunit GlcE [Methylobacter sp. YRD-M1]